MPPRRLFAPFAAVLLACELFATPVRAADNVGVVEIPDPRLYSQVAAISDVHGEYARLKSLLTQAGLIRADGAWAGGKTLLVVVGDSIDKGPESLPVLEFWQDLQARAAAKGGRIVVLLGNHEAEYLANPDADPKSAALYAELKQRGLPDSSLSDPARTIDHHALGAFIRGLPLAARVGGWLFCHAGWIAKPESAKPDSAAGFRAPDANWKAFEGRTQTLLKAGNYANPYFVGTDSILRKETGDGGKKWWKSPGDIHDLEQRLDSYGLRGVVLGHQPGAFGLDGDVGAYRANPAKNRFFKTDSGMAPVLPTDTKAGRDGYLGHLLLFTHPSELMSPKSPDPAHVFSLGFDPLPGGGAAFTRKAAPASEK